MEIVTVATHSEGRFEGLAKNKYEFPVTVLGFGQPWTGFKMKLELLHEHIQTLPDDQLIVFLDGFDSVINGNPATVPGIFKENEWKVVFSTEVDLGFSHLIFPACGDRNLNAGMFMGYVKYLKIILARALQSSCQDDQYVLANLCKEFDFISVDKDRLLFKNFYQGEVEGHDASFHSYPGTITFKRVRRAVFEYGQFLILWIAGASLVAMYMLYRGGRVRAMGALGALLALYFAYMDKSCIVV